MMPRVCLATAEKSESNPHFFTNIHLLDLDFRELMGSISTLSMPAGYLQISVIHGLNKRALSVI